jgi:hypothetical protein
VLLLVLYQAELAQDADQHEKDEQEESPQDR